eukprot:9262599-Alexandrium_andersonii.AAC.1
MQREQPARGETSWWALRKPRQPLCAWNSKARPVAVLPAQLDRRPTSVGATLLALAVRRGAPPTAAAAAEGGEHHHHEHEDAHGQQKP